MFIAELTCSDEDCELTLEALGTRAELERLVCDDCGCCLQVVALSSHEAGRLERRLPLPRAA